MLEPMDGPNADLGSLIAGLCIMVLIGLIAVVVSIFG